jgi:hypothetical protein
MLDPNLPLNGLLPHQNSLCVIRYISEEDPQGSQTIKQGEERRKEELEQTSARTGSTGSCAGTILVSRLL